MNAAPATVTDPRAFGRVAVVLGGSSAEREVSLDSGAGVLRALLARGVDAFAVDGVPALLDAIRRGRVDRVFIILHGRGGEDGTLQGALECLGVPYTGSGVLGSALAMDKVRTKRLWQALGLPTPAFAVVDAGKDAGSTLYAQVEAAIDRVGFPAIVKPSHEGSSVGITRVHGPTDVAAAIALAARYDGELLIERLVEGDEFTVGILGARALPSIRIVPAGEYYDYHAKYVAEDTQYLCPGAEGEEEAAMRRLAREAFDAVGCSGWGRVDIMRDRDGRPWLLEVNTAPGMTSHSLVPKAAAQVGIDFESLVWRILEMTLPAGEGATR